MALLQKAMHAFGPCTKCVHHTILGLTVDVVQDEVYSFA